MTPYQEGSGVGATTSSRRYWTLAAHPARYRVVDAVRDLEEDWWLTGRGDLHAGDRVAIWKYKGADDRRGIIAFGEVLTDPEMRDESGDAHTYWIDSDAKAAAPRVLVRYVIKPSEPLWLELAPADSVIRQLPVSRAQGGTAHHVTADQWAQLMALVGGWPQPDADEQDPPDWTDAEIQPTVTSYFTMLRAELAGQPYVKAAVNREVQAATGRSRGAVEYKFQNISAVLRDIGLPYIPGYKPAPNLQNALRTEVERFLARDPEIQRLIDQMPAPDVPATAQLIEVDPPVITPPSTGGRGRITTAAIDYLERQARNRDVGLKGELLVVEHERAWLTGRGRPDLANQVAHVPSTLGDGAGYDVSSFLLDGSPHHIEVKATRGSITAPFFLSANELRHALEHPEAQCQGWPRPFLKETRSALDIEGKHVTIQGPSPDLTSSVSGLLGDLAHLLRAWLRCPRRCPGVAVTTLGRPSHRARSGHAHPSWRRVSNARVGAFPRRGRRRCRRRSLG